MFAYCLNNPANYADPTGCFGLGILIPVIVCLLPLLSGCLATDYGPRGDLVEASSLLGKSAEELSALDRCSYNCYGNAIGKQVYADPTGYHPGDSTRDTFNAVVNDLGGSAYIRELTSIDDPIADDEYRVAMKCGPTDYHFIRQLDDGTWYNKSGNDVGFIVSSSYVATGLNGKGNWFYLFADNSIDYPVYTYETIYFAIKKGWDFQ